MKIAVDTSVLIAAAVEDDPRHVAALAWLQTRKRLDRVASLHAYAEAFGVLTALPIDPPITGHVAIAVLTRLAKVVRFVAPTQRIYAAAAERCAQLRLRSDAIFDAIHAVTAESLDATAILTFDDADFVRLMMADGPRIIVPSRESP